MLYAVIAAAFSDVGLGALEIREALLETREH